MVDRKRDARGVAAGAASDSTLPLQVTFDMEPIRLAPLYSVGLAVVAITMVLLPVIYVALIALVGYGVWIHATTNYDILLGGGSGLGRLLVYVGPIVVGALGVLFMVKPIFARPPRAPEPKTLSPDAEPLLHAYVEALCASLGAPSPRRIDVDMRVNASAGFRRGFGSFLGNDLVLTLGMPLTAGLTLAQWTGVLAHEFGHFTQGAAMRLSYVIGRVNHWLARVVYERDQWDLRLERWVNDAKTGWGQIILLISQAFIWLSRRVLWVLMMIGATVSGFLSRQMEFNADLHQARVSGGEVFKSTHLRIQLLSLAWSNAMSFLSEIWKEKRIVDDAVEMMKAETERLAESDDLLSQIEAGVAQERTGALDTHPATGDRIRAIERGDHPARMADDGPATALFADFGALAQEMTRTFYEGSLGDVVGSATIVPARSAIADKDNRIERSRALGRFFQQSSLVEYGLFPVSVELPAGGIPEAFARIAELRARMETDVPLIQETSQAIDGLLEDQRLAALWVRHQHGGKAERAGARLGGLGPPPGDVDPEEHLRGIGAKIVATRGSLVPQFATALERLGLGLAIAADTSIAARLPVAAGQPSASRLVSALGAIEPVWPRLRRVQRLMPELAYLAEILGPHPEAGGLLTQVQEIWAEFRDHGEHIHGALSHERYPYEHAAGEISLAEFACDEIPEVGPEVVPFIAQTGQNIAGLYFRIWSDLASLALEVEALDDTATGRGAGDIAEEET